MVDITKASFHPFSSFHRLAVVITVISSLSSLDTAQGYISSTVSSSSAPTSVILAKTRKQNQRHNHPTFRNENSIFTTKRTVLKGGRSRSTTTTTQNMLVDAAMLEAVSNQEGILTSTFLAPETTFLFPPSLTITDLPDFVYDDIPSFIESPTQDLLAAARIATYQKTSSTFSALLSPISGMIKPFSAVPTAVVEEGAKAIPLTPVVEAEVLTDMSHVIMDFTIFWRPSKFHLKICSVIGRILVLLADYLPDHSIHTEELMVQLILLCIGINDLVREVKA